ncbi:MAG TPA: hypothetical protein VJ752_12825 [Burkholderiaceae bacterium]|nr:hypothetical protein [Burkholderiaceae bacterium]
MAIVIILNECRRLLNSKGKLHTSDSPPPKPAPTSSKPTDQTDNDSEWVRVRDHEQPANSWNSDTGEFTADKKKNS